MLKKMVDEHNIVFITSAGNDGPALGTVGAPGGTCEKAIGDPNRFSFVALYLILFHLRSYFY